MGIEFQLQDVKVIEIYCTKMCIYLHLKMVKMVNFILRDAFHN